MLTLLRVTDASPLDDTPPTPNIPITRYYDINYQTACPRSIVPAVPHRCVIALYAEFGAAVAG